MTNETYFHLEGDFLGVCALDGYLLKYMRLRTADSPQERVGKNIKQGFIPTLYFLRRCPRIRQP
jgi:hypothetical protein